jgi:2-methylisocitrate lyase-like PEP mutase family enzyme
MSDQRRKRLRAALDAGPLVSAPGVYDMISALLADRHGFEAIYLSGYGAVASHLGLPDAGLATYTDMLSRVATMAGRTTTPLIADADTGYGGLLNVAATVRGYESAGAAALQLEDQEFPKRCGHTPGRRCIPATEMVEKVRVAVEARTDPDFLIIARTDARTEYGLDDALARARAYAAAGADVIFVESPESVAEMEAICQAVDKPTLLNMVEGGRTPLIGRAEMIRIGYRLAIFPTAPFLAAAEALDKLYQSVKDTGATTDTPVALYPFSEMNKLMGFEAIWDFYRRHAGV